MRIGIDLGGTNTVAGLCDSSGQLLLKKSRPTKSGNPQGLLEDMRALCQALCMQQGVSPAAITQIGIGVPGTINKDTCTLVFGPNLAMTDVCFAKAFAPLFSCDVMLENDANCAALGEYIAGAGQGTENMIMVTLGTGIGGGLLFGGKLYTGKNNIAGEIGHMVIVHDGWKCGCGRAGCWEAYSSAEGMVRIARDMLPQTPGSMLTAIYQKKKKLSAKDICDARDGGDLLAGAVYSRYLSYLACGINNLIAALQPEKIIIGGGLSGYGDKLLHPLEKLVKEQLMPADCAQSQLVLAKLGNDAGIIGAAML